MAIIPNFSYEKGYLVSHFDSKDVYLKFKQNKYTDSDIGHIKLTITLDNGNSGCVAWTVSNYAYGNMPSFYFLQQATTLDNAIDDIIFTIPNSAWQDLTNNDRQVIALDLDNTDDVGMNWIDESSEDAIKINFEQIMWGGIKEGIIEIDADFPIYMEWTDTPEGNYPDGNYTFRGKDFNHTDYDRQVSVYGATDVLDKAENYYTSVTEIDSSDIYYLTNYVYKNGTLVQSVNYQFQFAKKGRNYVYIDGKHAEFRTTLSTFKVQSGSDPTFHVVDEVPDALLHLYDNTEWVDFNNGDNYVSHLYTNLKCVYSSKEEQDYKDGLIVDDEVPKHPSNIGEGLTSNTVNTGTCNWVGATIWNMSEQDLIDIFKEVIYTPDDTYIDEMKKGLWMYNSDPIQCISSLYYVPFDVSTFVPQAQGTFKLGAYTPEPPQGSTHSGITYIFNKLKPEGVINPITLFNTMFTPIYNDYRDYTQVQYELFLPFKGFVPLDNSKYLNKMIKCEMLFDATTHEVRYYLYANGVISDRFDCSVGIDISLITTAKNEKFNALPSAVSSSLNTAQGLALGNVSSVTGGVMSALDSIRQITSSPSTNGDASFSSGLNIYDIRYCYLKITTNETIKPSNLNARYNYPSYFIGKGSSLSGYCEISDIRFSSFTGTQEEQNELKNIVKSGIIL